jgi:hypothetical protein
MNIKDIVENPHPFWLKYNNLWNFLLSAYEGGYDYTHAKMVSDGTVVRLGTTELNSSTQGNLFKHPKERNDDYAARVEMSYYYNFVAPVIDIYTDHLFKQGIEADFGSIDWAVQEQAEDIDRMGSSVNEFRKEMADLAQIYGHVFVVADLPIINEEINSRADVIRSKALPYFSFYPPQNVINWSLDRFGRPYWILLSETLDFNENVFAFDRTAKEMKQYRLWTRDEWYLFDTDYNQIATGRHGLGLVPVTCVFDKRSKKAHNFLGVSFVSDIAFIARDIFNLCSELRQILRDQTFAFLALQGTGDEYNEIILGTGKGLCYPEGRNAPQYISPPPQNAEVYANNIDRQVSKIFQLAKLEGGSAKFDGQTAVEQSGVSKAWDFNQTNSALSKKASNLEDGETKLWQIFARWNGQEFDGSIQYPDEFSIQSLFDDLNEAEKLARQALGDSFDTAVKTAIIKKKFPRMPETDIQVMIDEMKANLGKGQGGRLFDQMFGRTGATQENQNAYSGGKKEE